jgi:hypothetical protein
MSTETFTGTVTAAEWREETMADAYWLTLATDDGQTVELRGTQRMNAFPTAGQRIRIAGNLTPKGHYNVRALGDQVDPATAMPVQVEVL